jgi:hypothetical protein
MASSVEGAVIFPALFLAGARSALVSGPAIWIACGAIAARLCAGLLAGGMVAATSPAVRRGGPGVALAFFSVGPFGVAVALAIDLRYPGPAGDLVLATTVAAAIAGEFLGPPALRRALRRAGELPATPAPLVPPEPAREGSP